MIMDVKTSKNAHFKSNATMDTQTDWFCLQITFKDKTIDDVCFERGKIYTYFVDNEGNKICNNIFLIAHDKDLDGCSSNHLHILLTTKRRMRLLTMLNLFVRVFGYNEFAISIDKCILLYGYIRYILHISGDVEGKHQYSIDDLLSNVSLDMIETYLDSEDDRLDAERLIRICLDNDFDLLRIMSCVGIDAYKRYRYVIQDIISKEYQIRQTYKSKTIDLPF